MTMATGFEPFGKDWDPKELRRCMGICRKPMRHRTSVASEFPGTVRHLGSGMCDSCKRISGGKPRKTSPEEDAARVRAAMAVQAQIRARRQARGITPDGKVLPLRVSTG